MWLSISPVLWHIEVFHRQDGFKLVDVVQAVGLLLLATMVLLYVFITKEHSVKIDHKPYCIG